MPKNKENKKECTEFIETDLGSRALNQQNNNKTIVVPKVALKNCGAEDSDEMNVSLVQGSDGQKFIKLAPKISQNPKSQEAGS